MPYQTTYCVSHAAPLVPEKFFDVVIGLGAYSPSTGVQVSELDAFWSIHRPVAYGVAGGYVLPKLVPLSGNVPDLIGVCSFRKIVTRDPVGVASGTYPGMREITGPEASKLESSQSQPRDGCGFLLCSPQILPHGMVWQYAEVHNILDFFEYLSLAVRLGVLTPLELRELTMENFLIPGGCELGVYPGPWLLEALEQLKAVGTEFLVRYADRIRTYDQYQVRALGFLSERLGAFLLLRELKRQYPEGLPNKLIGHMCTIVNAESGYARGEVG